MSSSISDRGVLWEGVGVLSVGSELAALLQALYVTVGLSSFKALKGVEDELALTGLCLCPASHFGKPSALLRCLPESVGVLVR